MHEIPRLDYQSWTIDRIKNIGDGTVFVNSEYSGGVSFDGTG
jgi:hypothetical protein